MNGQNEESEIIMNRKLFFTIICATGGIIGLCDAGRTVLKSNLPLSTIIIIAFGAIIFIAIVWMRFRSYLKEK